MVGTGSAVGPYNLLLICAGYLPQPIRRSCHPRRSKASPSLVRLCLSTRACFGRSLSRISHPVKMIRVLRPVSQSTGISTRTHLFGRAWGAIKSAPILRCLVFRLVWGHTAMEPSSYFFSVMIAHRYMQRVPRFFGVERKSLSRAFSLRGIPKSATRLGTDGPIFRISRPTMSAHWVQADVAEQSPDFRK